MRRRPKSGRPMYRFRLPLLLALLVGVFAMLASAPRAVDAAPPEQTRPAVLRVGLIPNQAPDRIRAQYQPFGQYLSSVLDMPVELFVATDYAGVVEAMA